MNTIISSAEKRAILNGARELKTVSVIADERIYDSDLLVIESSKVFEAFKELNNGTRVRLAFFYAYCINRDCAVKVHLSFLGRRACGSFIHEFRKYATVQEALEANLGKAVRCTLFTERNEELHRDIIHRTFNFE